MSHTKGPWETTDQINVGGDRPLKAGATRIGSICRTGVSREEADANARLIIAAPDLLAACEEWEQGIIEDDFDMRLRGIKAMRAAVAKAKGVQP